MIALKSRLQGSSSSLQTSERVGDDLTRGLLWRLGGLIGRLFKLLVTFLFFRTGERHPFQEGVCLRFLVASGGVLSNWGRQPVGRKKEL